MPTAAIESAQGKSKRGGKPDPWELDHDLHTLRRAAEIVSDKKRMGHVRRHAAKRATEAKAVAHQAEQLAKAGKISPKAMEKLADR